MNPAPLRLAPSEGIGTPRSDLPDRLSRYARAHDRAALMASHLAALAGADDPGLPMSRCELRRRAEELHTCGSYLVFRDYWTADVVRLHAAKFCKLDKLCPLCAIRRGGRYVRSYMERIAAVESVRPGVRAFLLTVTVKDGPDLLERFQHLHAAWSSVLERRRNAAKGLASSALSGVLGGVSSIEFKRGEGSCLWHPHLHAVLLADGELGEASTSHRWPDLSAEWRAQTGDSFIVDVRPISTDLGDGLCEVFKYALKFTALDLADNLRAFVDLRGRRLVRSFGCLFGVEVPDELTDAELSDDLPFIDLFFRFTPGVLLSGYTLAVPPARPPRLAATPAAACCS